MATTMDGERLKAIRVSGSKFTGELEQLTTGVSFSMALDKVTSMTLGLADDYNLSLFRSRLMDKGASISYGEWNLTIDKVDLGSNDAGPHLTVDAMSTFVYKWEDQFGAKTWTDADVTSAQEACDALLAAVDPTRTSWTRTSWSSSFDK